MGGDKAPALVVEGAVRAVQQASASLRVLLCGREALLRAELAAHEATAAHALEAIEIVDAPEVIGMAEAPVAAVKTKRHSSIHVGMVAHKQGQADAFISVGNTGAVMAASLFILGRLPGVARPSVPAISQRPKARAWCSTSARTWIVGRSTCFSLPEWARSTRNAC